jgi:hypothetical protein
MLPTYITSTDENFNDYDVFIYGKKQFNVISANTETGEVFRYMLDDQGTITLEVELATGEVSIRLKVS